MYYGLGGKLIAYVLRTWWKVDWIWVPCSRGCESGGDFVIDAPTLEFCGQKRGIGITSEVDDSFRSADCLSFDHEFFEHARMTSDVVQLCMPPIHENFEK